MNLFSYVVNLAGEAIFNLESHVISLILILDAMDQSLIQVEDQCLGLMLIAVPHLKILSLIPDLVEHWPIHLPASEIFDHVQALDDILLNLPKDKCKKER